MPSSAGRSAPNRSNSAVIAAGSAASAVTSIRVISPAGNCWRHWSSPPPWRDTATMVRAPIRASWVIRCGPILPLAPMTSWLLSASSTTPGLGTAGPAAATAEHSPPHRGTPLGPRRRGGRLRPAPSAPPRPRVPMSSRSMRPPQIWGCSKAMLRPNPHNTACTGLARSPSTTGWALRVTMNNRAGAATANQRRGKPFHRVKQPIGLRHIDCSAADRGGEHHLLRISELGHHLRVQVTVEDLG